MDGTLQPVNVVSCRSGVFVEYNEDSRPTLLHFIFGKDLTDSSCPIAKNSELRVQ